MDGAVQDQSDIGDSIAGIKEKFPFLILFFAHLQVLQERQDIGFSNTTKKR